MWEFNVTDGTERMVVDPLLLGSAAEKQTTAEERFMLERRRERSEGIITYATDSAVSIAAFVVASRLAVVRLDGGEVRLLGTRSPVLDPRPSPDGRYIAYVHENAMRVLEVGGTDDRVLAEPEHADIGYGLPEYVAAEDMGRCRGYWWSPDSTRLLTARVDESMVERWFLADPTRPDRPPREIPYPAAGTANADVSLWIFGLDGRRTEVMWDRQEFEYLIWAGWTAERPLLVVQDRSQQRARVLEVDPVSGVTTVLREDTDPRWVSVVPGVPAVTEDGRLVWAADMDGAKRLLVDGAPVSPAGAQVREVTAVDGDRVLFTASEDPTQTHLWEWTPQDGAVRITEDAGVWAGLARGGTTVVHGRTPERVGFDAGVRRDGKPAGTIACAADPAVITPNVRLLTVGSRKIRVAVVLPTGYPESGPELPVLVDSYGGPNVQRVLAAQDRYVLPQWFAEHGFAVVVADGRGSLGRSTEWLREIRGDFATPVLQDQVDALHGAANALGCLDLSRVAIRGWSFAGYLSMLAVLRRPDVFHAAVALGAPTDMRLYATYWMERYLGHPDRYAENYRKCSLIDEASRLTRPLMLIHGMADDNVFIGHAFRLSAALLAEECPHTFVPLPTSSHYVNGQPGVERSVCEMQISFIKKAFGLPEDLV
mgnify:CR=1 FL=1